MLKNIVLIANIVFSVSLIFAQEIIPTLENWYKFDLNAKRYQEIKVQIIQILELAEGKSIPLWILMEKLKEGAAKKIAPTVVLRVLEQETQRLESANLLLQQQDLVKTLQKQEKENTLKDLSLILLNGIESKSIAQLYETAKREQRVPNVLPACYALVQTMSITSYSQEQLLLLGKSLIRSKLPIKNYASLPSVLLRANARGIHYNKALQIILTVLDKGGGLIQMEQELSRRTVPE